MKPIWTILITAVATAAIAGGGTYYLANKSADKDKSDLQAQIDDLSAKVSGTTVVSGKTATSGTTVAAATADWKTYTSTAFTYSIKYPTDWTLADTATVFGSNSIALTSPETKRTNDEYTAANPNSRSAVFPDMGVTYYASISDTYGGLGGARPATVADYVKTSGFSDSKQITFAGQTAYSATQGGDVSGYVIVLENSGHIYKISSLNNKIDSDLTVTEKNILNTFIVDPTLGWKTYTNATFGLTFKYPTEWTLDKKPVEIDSGSVLSVSYSTTEALFKVSVFSSVQNLPKLEDPAGNSNATSLANYFASQNMTSSAVKVGIYDGFDVNHSDIGGSNYYYVENLGKVYVFRIDARIKESADKIFSTLQLTK